MLVRTKFFLYINLLIGIGIFIAGIFVACGKPFSVSASNSAHYNKVTIIMYTNYVQDSASDSSHTFNIDPGIQAQKYVGVGSSSYMVMSIICFKMKGLEHDFK